MCFFHLSQYSLNLNKPMIGLLSSCRILKWKSGKLTKQTTKKKWDVVHYLVTVKTFQRFISSNSPLDDMCYQVVNQLRHNGYGLCLSPSILPVRTRSVLAIQSEIGVNSRIYTLKGECFPSILKGMLSPNKRAKERDLLEWDSSRVRRPSHRRYLHLLGWKSGRRAH